MESNHLKTVKDLHWVYQSMVNWASFSSDRAELKAIADMDYDTFFFLQGKINKTDNIHAYFGYYNDRLYIHFIPSSIDVTSSFTDKTIIPVELHSCIVTKKSANKAPIQKNDAEIRMLKWDDRVYRNQILDTATFFQLFWIPNENFQDNTPLMINFGIHNGEVDLVLTQMSTMNNYLDTCKPIPPFKPTLIQSQFALLDQIKIWSI
ncbi:hypothetical protein [Myroides sp. WP-1]|uniref:hypothetical protein n=1 Tax=Myroides sp. WP-1 TaxID=2759944 RepID=UPI0015F8DCB0|nr:hypothetical protein [Myroides sp. WP-1]MBB1139111.1 hypothetical protein [Myroides sp. WP-1]